MSKASKYIERLQDRVTTLQNRKRGSQLRDTQEIDKELHALEWAISELSSPGPKRIDRNAVIEECAKAAESIVREPNEGGQQTTYNWGVKDAAGVIRLLKDARAATAEPGK